MSLTNRYDPHNRNHAVMCPRAKCAELERAPHPAGVHLDQRHEFYDGPSGQLSATSMYIRDSARKIIREAPGLTPEVVDLITYMEHLQDQATHSAAGRDRGIREAMACSESCEAHGEEIKRLGEQVHAFDETARRNDAGRLAALGFLFGVDELLAGAARADLTVEELLTALKKASKKTHAAHDRAWKR